MTTLHETAPLSRGGRLGPRAASPGWRRWLEPAWIFWLISELFRAHHGRKSDRMPHQPDESIPTRESLLHRLKDWDDSTSWKEFFDTYWKLIYGVARKAGLNDSEAQDVVQETVIAVSRKMPEFTYDPEIGSFKAWLRQLTRWRITDQLRKQCYENKGQWIPRERPEGSAALADPADPAGFDLERIWDEEWDRTLMAAALKKVRERAEALPYQMFYLHVIKQMPARDVAERLGVKLAEVYFAKYKISAQVKKAIQALERTML